MIPPWTADEIAVLDAEIEELRAAVLARSLRPAWLAPRPDAEAAERRALADLERMRAQAVAA